MDVVDSPHRPIPLVDRLVDAGADLGEFVSGAGETLRAVLLAGLGGRPEGLTEGMQLLIRKYSSLLPAADCAPAELFMTTSRRNR